MHVEAKHYEGDQKEEETKPNGERSEGNVDGAEFKQDITDGVLFVDRLKATECQVDSVVRIINVR